jgi:hypothetical protein
MSYQCWRRVWAVAQGQVTIPEAQPAPPIEPPFDLGAGAAQAGTNGRAKRSASNDGK